MGGNKLGLGGGKQAGPGLWEKLGRRKGARNREGASTGRMGEARREAAGAASPGRAGEGKHTPPNPATAPTCVRLRGSAERAAVYLGLRTGAGGPLGIVVLCSLGPRQGSWFCALIPGGKEAEGGGASLGFSTTELQLPAGLAGR